MTSLNQRERSGRDAGAVREVFLGQTTFATQLADRFAKSGLRLVGATHWRDVFKRGAHDLDDKSVAICARSVLECVDR